MLERERGLLKLPLSLLLYPNYHCLWGEAKRGSFLIFLAGLHLPLYSLSLSLSPLLWLFVAPASACGGEPSGERPSLSIPPPSRFPYPHSAIPQPKPTVLQWGEEEGDSTAGCRLPQVSAGACTVSFFLVLPM